LFGASQLPVVDSSFIPNWFEELKAKVPATR
jgi:hypothetical protein